MDQLDNKSIDPLEDVLIYDEQPDIEPSGE